MKPVGNEEEDEDGEIQEGEIPMNKQGQAATPGSTAGEIVPHQGLQKIEEARSLLGASPGVSTGVESVSVCVCVPVTQQALLVCLLGVLVL